MNQLFGPPTTGRYIKKIYQPCFLPLKCKKKKKNGTKITPTKQKWMRMLCNVSKTYVLLVRSSVICLISFFVTLSILTKISQMRQMFTKSHFSRFFILKMNLSLSSSQARQCEESQFFVAISFTSYETKRQILLRLLLQH